MAVAGYWLASSATLHPVAKQAAPKASLAERKVVDETGPKFRSENRVSQPPRDDEAAENGALRNERTVVFKDKAALEAFLKRAGDKVKILGSIDALHALRIGFSDAADLAGLLGPDDQASLIYPVDMPTPTDGTVQPGAVSLGARLLSWLGITMDNSSWGKGVLVAILDTGVTDHPAFSSKVSMLNLVALPSDPAAQNGHGTAVASMIIGNNQLTPGIAPGASVLSVRIANDNGQGDSFLLAQGIIAAVDAGAKIINISMGSPGDSPLVRDAIAYAAAANAVIVAAAGNNGLNRVSYPAANAGVIAVGAVDAMGNHLDFSNSGSQLAIAAPGYNLNAAWTGGEATLVTGTSFSSPIVAGSIAALMSRPGATPLTASQAATQLFSYLDDAGVAGTDPEYGTGLPDLGRVINGKTPGIYDAAVASQRIVPPSSSSPFGQVEVLVQNRGTEPLYNTSVTISTPSGNVTTTLTNLAVNGVQTVRVPITVPTATSLRYDSRVSISGHVDAKPSNDRRVETYVPVVSP